MVLKSLVKLIDEALIPAIFIIVAKMAGILAVSYFFSLSFTLEKARIFFILPAVSFASISDYQIAENYSNLAMFTAVAIGTLFVLIRVHFFHATHIKPQFHAKLEKFSLSGLVAPSYHLYHQAVIWLIYLWLVIAFLIISSLAQITYSIISVIAVIIAANFSWIFAVDIEREIDLYKENL